MNKIFVRNLIILYISSIVIVLGVIETHKDFDNRGVIERLLSGE